MSEKVDGAALKVILLFSECCLAGFQQVTHLCISQ